MKTAFAILFLLVGTPIHSEVADEVQIGFYESAPWDVLTGGYYGTYRVAAGVGAHSPKKSVTWRVNVPQMNHIYVVQTTWTADPTNAKNAKYSIYDGKHLLGSITMNQQVPPHGDKSGNSIFQDLGAFTIAGPTLMVELTNEADGQVVADTIRIK